MSDKKISNKEKSQDIPFRMHPRIFSALGADLVTNDVVAVIELVKNSYDAFATKVWIRFRKDPINGPYLEIEDNGTGMSRETIENVWCLVATPYKKQNSKAKLGKKFRRVSGEKGLGRFSVARLGEKLHMLTQEPSSTCWQIKVNWADVVAGDDLSSSFITCQKYSKMPPFNEGGTLLRIFDLKQEWDRARISDLEDNLARLISPFSLVDDFNIYLSESENDDAGEVRIEAPEFLKKPKYGIKGNVDEAGNIKASYRFRPITEGKKRNSPVALTWDQVNDSIYYRIQRRFSDKPICGPFTFEIRAWDIDVEGKSEIAQKFSLQKSQIRKTISAHKGISLYRDEILVLPKSEKARDWLGLDLRRVSKVGVRMSTNQLVGYVSISAEKNPEILDTSDRERLVSCQAVDEFQEILITIVSQLENERDQDREKNEPEKPMDDLFADLSSEELLTEVLGLAEEGADASDVLPRIQDFKAKLDFARTSIQKRFVFYSHMATVGTIALMLVHEIRNKTTAFGNFLDFVQTRFGPFKGEDADLETAFRLAESSVKALERLADTFSPLASRSFRRRKRHSLLENQINDCLYLHRAELKRKGIKCNVPNKNTVVAVDPGELDAILLNLISNSVYWLGEVQDDKRVIEFRFVPFNEGTRIRVWIHDTGPGLYEGFKDKVERVFSPGITRKPGGIGMGLTVASELVSEYGGRMFTQCPGTKGGASFAFDLPLK